jgi:hypothetical protein
MVEALFGLSKGTLFGIAVIFVYSLLFRWTRCFYVAVPTRSWIWTELENLRYECEIEEQARADPMTPRESAILKETKKLIDDSKAQIPVDLPGIIKIFIAWNGSREADGLARIYKIREQQVWILPADALLIRLNLKQTTKRSK